jgi:hypothetical protein
VARLYRVSDAAEIAGRRPRLPPRALVEAWPDLYDHGEAWVGEGAREALEAVGGPLPIGVSIDAALVPIYYGPRVGDLESLPLEESLRARVVSAHGIAAAWITLDQFGDRTVWVPGSPHDPVFYLRRPGGASAHVWRLFRRRAEALIYMGEHYGRDPEARDWAHALPVEDWEELIVRRATRHA